MSSISYSGIGIGHFDNEWSENLNQYRYVWKRTPNSAGGVSVKFEVKNESQKTIKYLLFYITPYNRVYDAVGSEFSHQNEQFLTYVGPISPGETVDCYWENVWYNNSISSARADYVEVVYSDGSIETISGNDLSYIKYEITEPGLFSSKGEMYGCIIGIVICILMVILFFIL